MSELSVAIEDFLAQERLAVAGVSRDGKLPANHIFRKLKGSDYQVFPVNPMAEEVEGTRCYPDLASVPAEIQGVIIATPPEAGKSIVRECVELGIPRVWMHRSFGTGSVSAEAVDLCIEKGITVIPGACPMMYLEPVDLGHKCIRWFLGVSGGLPEPETGSFRR